MPYPYCKRVIVKDAAGRVILDWRWRFAWTIRLSVYNKNDKQIVEKVTWLGHRMYIPSRNESVQIFSY